MSDLRTDRTELDPAGNDTEEPPWQRRRGEVRRPDGRVCIGRVGAPPTQEATSEQFHFWVPPDALVEKTEIVVTQSRIGDREVTFYGLVEEVHRCSRRRSMGHEVDAYDGDLDAEPPFPAEGMTYATVSILRAEPPYLTPPREGSEVLRAGEEEAQKAYSADEIENPLAVGLVKNGGDNLAGPGYMDLDYLLGANGGHLNVNGAAGRGTKSSFLLHVVRLLLEKARLEQRERPSAEDRLRVVPIVLNVKGFDLFYIDRWNRGYDVVRHAAEWQALGVAEPGPFEGAAFYASQQAGNSLPVPTGRTGGVNAYSWGLRDIIVGDLLPFLFSEEDANDVNFGALLDDIKNWLTRETVENDSEVTRSLRSDGPQTFQELLEWVDNDGPSLLSSSHHPATWKKLSRRLRKVVYAGRGVLRFDEPTGTPLDLVRAETCDPLVIDLNALVRESSLQRFVVAAILQQLIEARTGSRQIGGLRYLVLLDELNRFAPKGARDSITQLVEKVAAEMRSQGILLLGAQQQASKVSDKVVENAGIRALGKTGALEMANTVWGALSRTAKRKADSLPPSEKLILQDNFREPMHVRVPFPAWAMRREEVRPDAPTASADPAEDDELADL